ncbi:MAG TPA: hypothetical protein VK088_03345 [Acidimicrobiia bacterium]|nr:hypothetical protein [Acidimicrobiia bacterium]
MTPLYCRLVRTTLAARVLDTGDPPRPMEAHVATCLRCQAVAAQSRRLRRTLADLQPVEVLDPSSSSPPLGWVAAGVASLAAAIAMMRHRHSA